MLLLVAAAAGQILESGFSGCGARLRICFFFLRVLRQLDIPVLRTHHQYPSMSHDNPDITARLAGTAEERNAWEKYLGLALEASTGLLATE